MKLLAIVIVGVLILIGIGYWLNQTFSSKV